MQVTNRETIKAMNEHASIGRASRNWQKKKKVKCSRGDERHANRFAIDLIPLDLNTV